VISFFWLSQLNSRVHVTSVGSSRAKIGQNLGSDVGIGGLVRIIMGMVAERCISTAFRSRGATKATEVASKDLVFSFRDFREKPA